MRKRLKIILVLLILIKKNRVIKEEYLTSKNKENFISHTIINLNVEGASIEFIGRYRGNENLIDVFCKVHHNADNTKVLLIFAASLKQDQK